jgi:hypothetical protein
MDIQTADKFFQDVDYVSIIDTVKGIMTSDGSMATLLDYERVLDEADLYAYKNWELGELVQGPDVKRYTVSCIFMWPYKLMPDPRACKRLASIGCKIKFKKTHIKVPVEVLDYEDFVPGTRYPKMAKRHIWLVYIEMPKELMDEIREGSIDLADQTIDLEELSDSYEDDLDQEDIQDDPASAAGQSGNMGMNAQTPQGTTPPLA